MSIKILSKASYLLNIQPQNLGQDVVSNALRLNKTKTKMQIRASKLARKHFYSLLHPTDSNARLGRDVVILSPTAKRLWRQDPLVLADNSRQDVVSNAVRLNNSFAKMQIRASKLARKHFYSLLHPEARAQRDAVRTP